jgi:hypothetical protein
MKMKISQKTKTQLRAGVVLTAFGAATWALASLPLEPPVSETPAAQTETVQPVAPKMR